ncbi:unnamed protein product [Choristocarpus tenellus]
MAWACASHRAYRRVTLRLFHTQARSTIEQPCQGRLNASYISTHWGQSNFLSQGLADPSTIGRSAPVAFPWRSTPSTLNLQNIPLSPEILMEFYKDEDFLIGAEMAFQQVAAGVFQFRGSEVRSFVEGDGDGGEDKVETEEKEEIVDPRDVMEKDLADFYIDAQAVSNCCSQQAVYKLHRVLGKEVTSVQWIPVGYGRTFFFSVY